MFVFYKKEIVMLKNLLFLFVFLLMNAPAAQACKPNIPAIQAMLEAKALTAAQRGAAEVKNKQLLNFHSDSKGPSTGAECPNFYYGEFDFNFIDGCSARVVVTSDVADAGQVTTSPSCSKDAAVSAPVAGALPEPKTICAKMDASGTQAETQCLSFDGATFFCPEGFEQVTVPAEAFSGTCGPYQ
jgi:hypothetical protein